MHFTINGRAYEADIDVRTSILDLCREHLGLTGAKKGCDHGQCGACTLLINGRRVNGCLTLAVMHQDDEITTIEGLGQVGALHPLQQAFVRHDGYQCGYCTPGQICSAVAMLDEVRQGWPSHVTADLRKPAFDDGEISERMSGNLCRCAAYPNIVDAIREVGDAEPDGRTADEKDAAMVGEVVA
ncbi:2Fe-2S iron-sulfur cluster-binding protein [Sphingomonas abietis]|uniref:2Fe-2S iron-sulfur cluster-binding protein n=1 Tax=Sphingomonas abietis TaxID=3012344 RepID=A0ABY7NIG0_9SPHN|nr:2Fe-2S iron-sulfur cluster-binding protein [Sphingomonas abietis]WBO21310.1 2Fe-2S iron-sulfur cluster-binding protein [Sphingomonas abietis]